MFSVGAWLIALIILIPLALWLWAVVDAIRSPFDSDIAKILVIVVMFWAPILGPILYFVFKERLLRLS
ncbi:MAG: phospholipase [Flavobacteriales bacterium]|nr:phospholipase [Flavobacteriales bacterium]|tara:strand:+ start:5379 stop:5582 length:204 start_codon:yes stop_codon:yes gene_type:complete